ncbi:hypothetical protein MauCBS54593_005615 [Microsporum audouinii]
MPSFGTSASFTPIHPTAPASFSAPNITTSHLMAAENRPTISTETLPSADSISFLESSFFTRNGSGAKLPSPAEVREQGAIQDPTSKDRNFSFRPVRYKQLGLIVKYGRAPEVTVAEGQLLWAFPRILPTIPVPEVYGWTHDNGQIFIYMELIQGVTLEQRWESLDKAERVGVCEQLRGLIQELRKLQHALGDFFLGHINRDPLGDIVFTNENRPPAGPFLSVAQFHDWIATVLKLCIRQNWPGKKLSEIPDPYRSSLPDDAQVVFTHADLHPSNIMVSEDSNKILAIIDWQQSGWYPDYWEFYKAAFTAEIGSEWVEVYIPLFLEKPTSTSLEAIDFYAGSLGY